jgi:oligopeptide/dipeptide ABC transporter ATP-binding protein
VAGADLLAMTDADVRRMWRTDVSMVYQNPTAALNPTIHVGDQVAEVFGILGAGRVEARRRAREMLTKVQISDPDGVMGRYPHQLSGGMNQRVVIAMALAKDPSLLVLDEPTTGLDATVEAEVLDLVAALRQEFNTSVLFISHNLDVILRMCDRVGVLYAGRIVEQGPVAQVFADPQHPYTRELLASTISLTTTQLHFLHGSPPDLVEPPQGCRFHPRCPHAMKVCLEDPVPVSVRVGPSVVDVECWLHGPAGRIPADGRDPLPRRDLETADEA